MSNAAEILSLINAAAEQAVLGAMRNDSELAEELAATLTTSDFYYEKHRILFAAIVDVAEDIEAMTADRIVAAFRRTAANIGSDVTVTTDEIEKLPAARESMQPHVNELKRLAWLREMGDFAMWLASELQANPDPTQLYFDVQERMSMLRPPQKNNYTLEWEDVPPTYEQMMRQRKQELATGKKKFDWPWASWNRKVRPLDPGNIGVIAAQDGIGKSTYLEYIAEHWARQGFRVALVHLEDSREMKLDRLASRLSGVDHIRIADGVTTDEEDANVLSAMQRTSTWRSGIDYIQMPGSSMADIIRELEARIDAGRLDVVVVDYLNKVQPTRAQTKLFAANSYERQAHDVEQLKTFAQRHNIPVMTAAQNNKGGFDSKDKTRANIYGSIQVSHKSQLVITLDREMAQMDEDLPGIGIVEKGEYHPKVKVRIDKQNMGQTGMIGEQMFIGRCFRVADIAKTELN